MLTEYKAILSIVLRQLGRLTPDIPKIRAFGNRILWPIHNQFNLGGGVANVLGVKMILDPSECVDRNLWFTPHLYDKHEIAYAVNYLKECTDNGEGVFIDAGANVGFWSIQIANKLPNTRVLAIEANPNTANILENNIALNNLSNTEVVRNGLGGDIGKLRLFCGKHGNRGGDSFKFHRDNAIEVMVDIVTLKILCERYGIEKIDFIKMDIEGMEIDVLMSFFGNAPETLYPKCICIECMHDNRIRSMLESNGYRLVKAYRENSLFSLK